MSSVSPLTVSITSLTVSIAIISADAIAGENCLSELRFAVDALRIFVGESGSGHDL